MWTILLELPYIHATKIFTKRCGVRWIWLGKLGLHWNILRIRCLYMWLVMTTIVSHTVFFYAKKLLENKKNLGGIVILWSSCVSWFSTPLFVGLHYESCLSLWWETAERPVLGRHDLCVPLRKLLLRSIYVFLGNMGRHIVPEEAGLTLRARKVGNLPKYHWADGSSFVTPDTWQSMQFIIRVKTEVPVQHVHLFWGHQTDCHPWDTVGTCE